MIVTVARGALRRWRTAASLAVAAAVNAGLAFALLGLARFDRSALPPARTVVAPLEVAWLEVRPREPEPAPPPEAPAPAPEQATPSASEASPPAPAATAPPLPLSVTLDLPDLPSLLVDPAASIESVDLDALTLRAPPEPVITSPTQPRTGPRTEQGVDVPPRKRFTPAPVFPRLALRRGIRDGRVSARLLVTTEGRVSRVVIESASPRGYFERAVETAVRNWVFAPARLADRAVDCWCRQTFQFELEGQ